MSRSTKKSFSEKHGTDQKPEDFIQKEVFKRLKDNAIACAVVFEIAKLLNVLPDRIGRTADLMNIKLVKCQLGLFGYPPKNKIVEPATDMDPELSDAIRNDLVGDRLPCRNAWEIAARFGVPKMAVSGVCEALGIKIKPCQLGAF
ncbi:MAG: hypothetical protein P1P89_19360 [Desulfobacterales bacterium]|nr:hypothetical protein [Desulfobacterales bacterium]